MNKDALIDNTAFAGMMRCYLPELESHSKFLTDFPTHKKIDFVSTAQILTAICCYDSLVIEASSAGHYHSSLDVLPKDQKQLSAERASSWANDLKKMLPKEIDELISTSSSDINGEDIWILSEQSRKLSFELFQTTLKNKTPKNIVKIPDVYTNPDYIDRKNFVELNSQSATPLNDEELSQAMFFHRGLLLDAFASAKKLTYIPYLYRAQYLDLIPPGKASEIFAKNNFDLRENTSPDEVKVIEELNKIYYETLGQLTWTKYENFIPFIGSSILSQTNYNIADAFNLALEFRNKSNIPEYINNLNEWSHDKVVFEMYLKEFRKDLSEAVRHFKLDTSTTRLESWANLSMFWLPNGLTSPVTELLKNLPESWRIYFNSIFNIPKLNHGHQILLFDHVYALKIIDRDSKK